MRSLPKGTRLPSGTTSLRTKLPQSPRRSKYHAKPVYLDQAGNVVAKGSPGARRAFDSQSEYRRWLELAAMQQAGRISGLTRQVRFRLHAAGGVKVASYIADFVYVENGLRVVEDRKGMRTAIYRLKKKWMAAEHGIIIRES